MLAEILAAAPEPAIVDKICKDVPYLSDPPKPHEVAWLQWRYVELLREFAFKSISFGCLGLWMVWIFGAVFANADPPSPVDRLFGWTCLGTGVVFISLGIGQALKVEGWGERGPGFSVTLLMICLWSITTAVWFGLTP